MVALRMDGAENLIKKATKQNISLFIVLLSIQEVRHLNLQRRHRRLQKVTPLLHSLSLNERKMGKR